MNLTIADFAKDERCGVFKGDTVGPKKAAVRMNDAGWPKEIQWTQSRIERESL